MFFEQLRKYRFEIISLGFCFYGLFLRGQKFAERPLYPDELQQINNTLGSLQPFWQRLHMGELSAFPGDYLLLWPMGQLFGNQKWAWALPHIIASIGVYYVSYLLSKRYFSSVWPLIGCMVLVTFNGNLIFHAFEIRPYAVLALLGPLVFYVMGEWMKQAVEVGISQRILRSIFLLAVSLYHAYGILIIACSGLFWLLYYRPWKNLAAYFKEKLWLVYAVILSLMVFGWFASGENRNNSLESFAGRFIVTFQYIPDPTENTFGFLKAVVGNLLGDRRWYVFLVGVILAVILSQQRWVLLGFFIVMILLPISLILASDIKGGYWFLQRQFVWTMPLFAFGVAWSWEFLLLHMRKST